MTLSVTDTTYDFPSGCGSTSGQVPKPVPITKVELTEPLELLRAEIVRDVLGQNGGTYLHPHYAYDGFEETPRHPPAERLVDVREFYARVFT